MDAPTAPRPMAPQAGGAAKIAEMVEPAVAVSLTAPKLVTTLVSMKAFVVVRMTLSAAAPAPLIAPLARRLAAIATDAAGVVDLIVALSFGWSKIPPGSP